MPPSRRIHPAERDAALGAVIEAFRCDPQLRWYFPREADYDRCAAAFFGVLLDARIAGGEVWVVEGAAAVSMWIPPGGNLLGPDLVSSRYAEVVAGLPDPAPERITALDELVDAMLPQEAHWYLGILACRSDRRGCGLGTAVTSPLLAAADRAGLPVALQTSTPDNVDYYTRRGFAVVGTRSIGGSTGPVVRVMRRQPIPPPGFRRHVPALPATDAMLW